MLVHDSADIILEVKHHTCLQIHRVHKPLLQSLFPNKRDVSAAYLEMKVTFIRCLVHKRPKVNARMTTFILEHSLNSEEDFFTFTRLIPNLFLDAVFSVRMTPHWKL